MTKKRLLAAIIILISVLGISLRVITSRKFDVTALCGSDFAGFYASGLLVGTPQLYSPSSVQTVQVKEMGCTTRSAMFLRLPFYAAFMWPWSRLPFWSAFTLWRVANAAAIGIFICLCFRCREWALLACAWSMPLAYGIFNGQDIGFLLMWIAITLGLVRRGAPILAGVALGMCAEKPHLFILLPLLLFRPSYKRMAYGFVSTAFALLIISFLVQGINWPRQFVQALKDSQIDPTPSGHFNLFGLTHGNGWMEALLIIGVVALAFYICCSEDLWFGLSAVLTGGLLVSHHQTPSDAALLIPVALILASHARARYSKVIAVFLISPLAYFLLITPNLMVWPCLFLLFLLGLLAWEVRYSERAPYVSANLNNGLAANPGW